MAHVFTKRNHYNPCFWTSLWNTEYFEAWARTGKPEAEPREQLVFALSLRSERIYRTKVSNLFYEKKLGVAKITPESMKTFYSTFPWMGRCVRSWLIPTATATSISLIE